MYNKNRTNILFLIILIVIIVFSLFLKQKTNSKNSIDSESQNYSPAISTDKKNETYVFKDQKPEKTVKIQDFFNDDHRSISVFMFDERLVLEQDDDKNILRIKNEQDSNKNEYVFYSDLKLLESLLSKEANLNDYVERQLTVKNGDIQSIFYSYEKVLNGIVYRKYSFNYGDTNYLIAVEMDESKKEEYTELTNKLLSTMIPHTMTPEYAEKLLVI